jgi:glycine/D-amino acid oxidase-like deaminating enzyme
MDLHSGAPFWLLVNGLEPESPPLRADAACEVAIIGAGISGALVADALAGAGLDTLIVDRRAPGLGSTAASTSLLQYELDVELHTLIEQVGAQTAVRAYRLRVSALATIERLALELDAEFGFERRCSLYLGSKKLHRARLTREYEARRAHGFDVELWDARQVKERYGFDSFGALCSADAAQIDALAFTRALLRRAEAAGARIYPRTNVTGIETREGQVTLRTQCGHEVRAGRAVFCPGYEMPPDVRPDSVTLHSTYALVTEPCEEMGDWADECVVWESARPYFYMRATADQRIICGGADLNFRDSAWRDRMLPGRSQALLRRLTSMLGTPARSAFEWAGTFAETEDGLPFIGPVPGLHGTYAALGYGGNGITFSVVAADIIRDLCLGRPNADAACFALDR